MIDATPLAATFQLLRDKNNGQITPSDVAGAATENFARPRYNGLTNRLDTVQGFILQNGYVAEGPYPDSGWVLIDGTHKTGDLFDTSPDHLDVALYGQVDWAWVPGATARFWCPYDCDVRVHIEADVVVPKNATLARTVQLGTMGGPQLQVPSYSAMFTVIEGTPGGPRAPDQATHGETHFLEPVAYGIPGGSPTRLPNEPTPQVDLSYPESPLWYRRRSTSTRLFVCNGERLYTFGLRIDPRADRVYVGSRSITIEAIYR